MKNPTMSRIRLWVAGVLLGGLSVAFCDVEREDDYVIHARVLHQDGSPVPSATVRSLYVKPDRYGDRPVPMAIVKTDEAGAGTLEFSSRRSPDGAMVFRKAGYYGSTGNVGWRRDESGLGVATVIAVLKPVKNPAPMYAYSQMGEMEKVARIPELHKKYGFDLMLAEPLPPLGNGKHADFLFWIEGRYDGFGSYDLRLQVEFQSPEDGVIEFLTPQRRGMRDPKVQGSHLLSDYTAPEDGYASRLTRTTVREGADQLPHKDEDFRRNYYFRTRTEADPSGRVVSAHYGKIYGDFHFSAANDGWGYFATLALVTTYFNPTPNDRNVEFDPKRNLHPEGNVDRP